jgi:hypothetical protein
LIDQQICFASPALSPNVLAQGARARSEGALIVKDAFIKMDQRAHPCKKLRFEYIAQGESRKINGLCAPWTPKVSLCGVFFLLRYLVEKTQL